MKKITIKGNEDFIKNEIKKGKIFIYPTDTVYGIGCDATNDGSIQKIYNIKKRESKPFLIIIPNLTWIKNNCECNEEQFEYIQQKLPGKFSFILKYTSNKLSKKIITKENTIGIRIPKCNFSELIKNKPFITTSVNFSGETPVIKAKEIHREILEQVDYIIQEDEELCGTPSTIYDLSKNKITKLR